MAPDASDGGSSQQLGVKFGNSGRSDIGEALVTEHGAPSLDKSKNDGAGRQLAESQG